MIKNKVDEILNRIFHHRNEELPAFLLQKLFHSGNYLPFTSSSLKMKSLACISNNIVVNQHSSILEFGSCISTIIMARLFKLNNIDGKIYSIDESAEWQSIIKKHLIEENIDQYVIFVFATTEKNNDLDNSLGYDKEIIKKVIQDTTFDMVVIDGPSAWHHTNVMSRVSNFAIFEEKLKENFTIFIDNANRPGEKALAKLISEKFILKPTKLDSTFVAFKKGPHFNFAI